MEIRLTDGESFNIKGGDGLKVDGQSVGGSVEVVAPNASAVEGQAADAKKTYEALEKKYDKPDTSTVALGTNALTGDAEGSGVGTIAIGENAKSQITGSIAIGQNAETTGPFPFASCLVAIGADAKATSNEPIVIGSDSTAITAKAKVVVTKDGVMTIGGKEVVMKGSGADDTLTKDGENPVKSKGIWSAIWGAIAAPAASVYEWVMTALDDKIDSNIDSKGRINLNEPIRLNAPLIVNTDKEGAGLFKGDIDNPYVSEGRASSIAGTLVNNAVDTHNNNFTAHQRLFYLKQNKLQAGANITLTPNGETVLIDATQPDLTPYAKTAEVLPRYPFVDAAIVDGVVTVAPYTNAKLTSDGTAFAVEVGEGSGYARDCVLVVDCGETSPSVVFDDTVFFPRGGDAANLEVVAGKRNVFFITEVQPNVFMVARDELALPNEGGGE